MKEIASALVKAQKAFGPALKTSTNPAFRSKYAKLENCIEAVIDALNDNGIMLMQPTHLCEDGVIVETMFLHESGEMLSNGKLHVPATKHDAQGYGSALTYARRYSLLAACGIAAEDDDGEAASKPKTPAKPVAQAAAPAKASPPPAKIEGKEGPWQLKVSIEPQGEFADWASIVMDATKSDVMALFRNNKNIFDRMKAEPGSSSYDALMEEFKTARNKFKEQA
jgi:hypothetical protein